MYNVIFWNLSSSLQAAWASAEGQGTVGWEPGHALGGHYGAVVDMCWGVDGSCLLTASTDQTCRITAQIQGRWSELARPQVPLAVMTASTHDS